MIRYSLFLCLICMSCMSTASESWDVDFSAVSESGTKLELLREVEQDFFPVFEVVYGGDVVRRFDGSLVEVESFHDAGTGLRYLILQEASGGSGCPATYTLFDFSLTPYFMSDSIGNCSDQPKISLSGSGVVIEFPAAGLASAVQYFYSNGEVSEKAVTPQK
ncbi:hypothetical protein [Microbulbifer yueqingensis]|uniref:hypothetical protein n=1 Tax=Microbulbifer yueqingensis TaxID=658219 RepID=UPI000B8112CE|nr:hypothetical protein [Microbulbifer yueqingensis]